MEQSNRATLQAWWRRTWRSMTLGRVSMTLGRVRWAYRGRRPALGLALSGGAARGVAHIGVLAALEEADIRPDLIAGTSAGAIVGSFWAAGWESKRLLQEVKELSWREILRPRLPEPLGLIDSKVIEEMALRRLEELRIEDLPVPFAAVAADLLAREPVVIREGPIALALRASCAIPGIFTPWKDPQDRWLVDGGVISNLPVEAAREMGADLVLAVDVGGAAAPTCSRQTAPRPPQNIFDVLEYSWLIQRGAASYRGRDPEWLITPDIPSFSLRDLAERADEISQAGYRAAQRVIPQLLKEWQP